MHHCVRFRRFPRRVSQCIEYKISGAVSIIKLFEGAGIDFPLRKFYSPFQHGSKHPRANTGFRFCSPTFDHTVNGLRVAAAAMPAAACVLGAQSKAGAAVTDA